VHSNAVESRIHGVRSASGRRPQASGSGPILMIN